MQPEFSNLLKYDYSDVRDETWSVVIHGKLRLLVARHCPVTGMDEESQKAVIVAESTQSTVV